MDRDGASIDRCVNSLIKKLNIVPVIIQVPIGIEDSFTGVVDLISMRKLIWAPGNTRSPQIPKCVPLLPEDEIYEGAIFARNKMLENLAEIDDNFLEQYLEDASKISETQIIKVLKTGCLKCSIVPVLCGASLRGKGVDPLLNAIVAFLPSPLERTAEVAVKVGDDKIKIAVLPDSDELCALAFKVTYDEARGPIVFVRNFGGPLYAKTALFNSSKQFRERPNQILEVNADDLDNISCIGKGNVGCIVGLKGTYTGDTLVVDKGPLTSFALEGLRFPKPVFSLAIEPEKSSQQADLDKALNILCLEDPSLTYENDKESGQTLISGIGELHLEIVCDKLKRQFNINVTTGKAYVAYRESIKASQQRKISVYKHEKIYGTKRMYASIEFSVTSTGCNETSKMSVTEEVQKLLSADEYTALTEGVLNSFIRGPRGFPVVGLVVDILSIDKDRDTTPGCFRACASAFIDSCLRSDDRILLEPCMLLEIETPSTYIGDILSDLNFKRRAVIKEVSPSEHCKDRNRVVAEVPLVTMLGYATQIRSLSQGEGFFSLQYLEHNAVDEYVANTDIDST